MPSRKNSLPAASGFRQVQQQARALLQRLQKDIRLKEAELRRLKEEATSLSTLTRPITPTRTAAAESGGGGGRINWRAILAQLPKQFKASDIRSVRGLKNKRPSEIFAAITRWIEAGLVKRRSRGVYERV